MPCWRPPLNPRHQPTRIACWGLAGKAWRRIPAPSPAPPPGQLPHCTATATQGRALRGPHKATRGRANTRGRAGRAPGGARGRCAAVSTSRPRAATPQGSLGLAWPGRGQGQTSVLSEAPSGAAAAVTMRERACPRASSPPGLARPRKAATSSLAVRQSITSVSLAACSPPSKIAPHNFNLGLPLGPPFSSEVHATPSRAGS